MLTVKPARKERLADLVYGQLLEQMARGALKEDDRLPAETEICERFGVSRPVVRQALARLQADGLIVAKRGAGTFVSGRPPAALVNITAVTDIAAYQRGLETRTALEPEAARLAAQRRTREQLATIQATFTALTSALSQGQRGDAEDFAFHIAVAEASGNMLFAELLHHLHETVQGQMAMALELTRMGSDERRKQVLLEHQRIVEAIAQEDGDMAALYMRYHLVQSRARTLNAARDL